jgi:nicotinamide-nucleotide amidase
MQIELITIGDELLLGFTIDTNAAHIARQLAPLGVEIVRRATVGDDSSVIAAAVSEALARTGAVITTGGLGPTSDDVTRPAIAAVFGRELRLDDEILARITALFESRGYKGPIPPSNIVQAMVPEGAVVLVNRHGTAPGIWLEDDQRRWVAMLPGVPREMRGMLAEELVPRVAALVEGYPVVVRSRTLRSTGIAESAIADKLTTPAEAALARLSVAYLPGADGVDVRLTVRGLASSAADELLAGGAAAVRERLGSGIYGEEEDDLAAVVLELCRSRKWRISVAESCTGGLLGARLTAIPGSSDVVLGGVIAYADDIKASLLGVPPDLLREHGAVSEAVAAAMAAGARDRTGAEVALAITGIAGPGGGSEAKPVGTVWLAMSAGGKTSSLKRIFVGDRGEIRHRAVQFALDMLRRELAEP